MRYPQPHQLHQRRYSQPTQGLFKIVHVLSGSPSLLQSLHSHAGPQGDHASAVNDTSVALLPLAGWRCAAAAHGAAVMLHSI